MTRMKLGMAGFAALVLGSEYLDRRNAPTDDTGRVVLEIVIFAVLWAGAIFVGVIAFRVLRKLWRWSAELK